MGEKARNKSDTLVPHLINAAQLLMKLCLFLVHCMPTPKLLFLSAQSSSLEKHGHRIFFSGTFEKKYAQEKGNGHEGKLMGGLIGPEAEKGREEARRGMGEKRGGKKARGGGRKGGRKADTD
jgi:hypothetical protein